MSSLTIPYPLRSRLSQLEPSLDLEWEQQLLEIFQQATEQQQEAIDFQILKPKKIIWDREKQAFRYIAQHSVEILSTKFQNDKMRYFASTLVLALKRLESLRDSLQIGDLLETALAQIDRIQVEEN